MPAPRCIGLLATIGVGVACTPHPKTVEAGPQLTVGPASLDFGQVAVRASVPLAVHVDNGGRVAGDATLTVVGPFTTSTTSVSVSAGDSAAVTVTFAPTEPGAAKGTLHVAGVGDVALLGEGLPPCVPSQPCLSSTFDLQTRRCAESPLAEGTACSAPCLKAQGECRGSFCVGEAASCVDGDLCTLDVCGTDGGCLNPPLSCPVTDPCQARFCDPKTGCGSTSVEDGTPCGEATCETAHLCLNGTCQARERPNATNDCRYTALAAGYDYTCAVTRGGDLRCWGGNSEDQQGRGYRAAVAPPGFAVGVGGLRSVAAWESVTWVSRQRGDVARVGGWPPPATPASLPIDAGAVAARSRERVCGVEAGALRCASFDDAGPMTIDDDVTAIASNVSQLCAVHHDGGVACGPSDALSPVPLPVAAEAASPGYAQEGCALSAGRVYCWQPDGGATPVWNSGATAVATSPFDGEPCIGTAQGIHCLTQWAPTDATTPPVTAVTVGLSHACALIDDGRIACWGNNSSGALGDRSPQPVGLQRMPAKADWAFAYEGRVFFGSGDGPPLTLQAAFPVGDGGVRWTVPQVSAAFSGSRSSYAAGCPCGFDAGDSCGPFDTFPVDGATHCAPMMGEALCVSRAGGSVTCYARAGNGASVADHWDAGGEVAWMVGRSNAPGVCVVLDDGTAHCRGGFATAAQVESLSGVQQLCTSDPLFGASGCAVLATGELRCWGPWVGSTLPTVPSGAWPLTRQLACGRAHVCTLSGINIVRCWGNNEWSQLGRDGPSRTAAAEVPMPGPVVSIAAGEFHTCALMQSGDILCWGDNGEGQLGQQALIGSTQPLFITH